MISALAYLARHGRHVLIVGLCLGVGVGLAFPELALALRIMIAPVVVTLLFLAFLRLGPEGVRAGLAGWKSGLITVLGLQLLLPLLAAVVFRALHLEPGWALGVVLVLAAAPITGSPNLAVLSGACSVTALRQLVLGTLLLPITVWPVLLFLPDLGAPRDVAAIVLRLLVLIGLACALGMWLRHRGIVLPTMRNLSVIDGSTTLLLAGIVIALMASVGPALLAGGTVWAMLALVLLLGFGLQIGTLLVLRGRSNPAAVAALGQAAGNRNIALFLGVLPPAIASDLLLFIGLYQIPMYLTPIVMGWLYPRLSLNLVEHGKAGSG